MYMRERVESMGIAPMLRDNDVWLEASNCLGIHLAEALQPRLILGVGLHRLVNVRAERVAFAAFVHGACAGD